MKTIPLSDTHIKVIEELEMVHEEILSLMVLNSKRLRTVWNEIKLQYPEHNFTDVRIDNKNKKIILPHQNDNSDA